MQQATEYARVLVAAIREWRIARSGEEKSAPKKLRSRGYPCIDAAPGRYVLDR
jgi:poly(3-hydroxyalkanoate) synthetase